MAAISLRFLDRCAVCGAPRFVHLTRWNRFVERLAPWERTLLRGGRRQA